jgi:hypothetical protein
MAAGGEARENNSFFSTGGEASPVPLNVFSLNDEEGESPVLKDVMFKYKYRNSPTQIYKEYIKNEFGQIQVNERGIPLTRFVENTPLSIMWPGAGLGKSILQTPEKFAELQNLFSHVFTKLKKYTKIVYSKLGKTRENYKKNFSEQKPLSEVFPEEYAKVIFPFLLNKLKWELSALRLVAQDFPFFEEKGLGRPEVVLNIFQFIPIFQEFETDYRAYLEQQGKNKGNTDKILKALEEVDLSTPIAKVDEDGSPTFLNMGGGRGKAKRTRGRKQQPKRKGKRATRRKNQ